MIRDPKAFRSGTGEIFTPYVEQLIAGPLRLDRLRICRARIRACRRGQLEAT